MDQPELSLTDEEETSPVDRGADLVSWIMARVEPWRTARDSEYREKWDSYRSVWLGEFEDKDHSGKKSARSRIVTPATMQAVDATCAEIEEAVFGREAWFDMDEDLSEIDDFEQRQEMLMARDQLRELLEEEGVPEAVAKQILIGAIYGTGIGKINTYAKKVHRYAEDGKVIEAEEARVELIPLEPLEFVPDPTTCDIDLMLGCAHETVLPMHVVREGMVEGRYRAVETTAWSPGVNDGSTRKLYHYETSVHEGVKITEWHGKVPAGYLASYMDERIEPAEDEDEDDLVEAIVTIMNEATVISAKPNPFVKKDRCFVAHQHDTVPGSFWGRGVVQKAFNAQKALDADVRARIDTMALVSNPMFAGDITRLPRGFNMGIWPGKFWPTTGDPGEVLQLMGMGQVNPDLFNNAADMERMVQTATGAMDPGASYSQAEGATGRAMAGSAFIKRARRTMQNIERQLLTPLVRKSMCRYVQFDTARFPQDYQFSVRGTLGVMAREIEQQQLTQLLSLVPNESPPFLALVKAVFDNSSSPHKREVLTAVDKMLNPPPPSDEEAAQQKMLQEVQIRGVVAEVEEKEAKAMKAKAEAQRALAQAALFTKQADLADENVSSKEIEHAIDLREVQAFEMQNAVSQMQQQLRAFDLALKAKLAEAQIGKINAEAVAIQRGTRQKLAKAETE